MKSFKSNKASGAKSATPLSAQQKRQVRDMLSATQETKAWYLSNATTASTVGSTTVLSAVPTGSTSSSRVGDALKKVSLSFSYTITVGAVGLIAAADQYNVVRVLVFTWVEDDGLSTPTVLNVLKSQSTTSQYNYDNRHDYRILYDKCHTVFNTPYWNGAAVTWSHGVGGTYASPSPVTIPLSGNIEFDSDTTAGTGHVYVLFVSDSAFTPNPSYTFASRMLYKDS